MKVDYGEENVVECDVNALARFSGGLGVFCALTAIVSIPVLYLVIVVGADNYADLLSTLAGAVYIPCAALTAAGCIASAVLMFINKKRRQALFTVAASLGGISVLGAFGAVFMAAFAGGVNGGWFAAFCIPYIVDGFSRIACAVMNRPKRRKKYPWIEFW